MTNLLIKANDFYSCAKSKFILHLCCSVNTDEIDASVCMHMFCITFIYMARRDREMQNCTPINQHCLLIYISLINKNRVIYIGVFICWQGNVIGSEI